MLGTFAGALDARKIDAKHGRLVGDVRGEVEATEDNVLVIRRVHVHYRLIGPETVRETVERVHGMYAEHCPLYRTMKPAFAITTDWELAPEG